MPQLERLSYLIENLNNNSLDCLRIMSDTTVDTGDVPSVESIAKLYNTYGLATRGFVWNAIASVSGDWGKGYTKTVNDIEPDENGNTAVSSISSIDYAGDLNQINADLSIIMEGEDKHRLLTDIDDNSIRRLIENNTNDIKSIFPEEASKDNKLADKEYVSKTIRKELPTFRGSWTTWTEVPEDFDKYPEDCDKNRIPKINDFIVVLDASGYSSSAKVSVGIVGRILAETVLEFEVGHVITSYDVKTLLDNNITEVIVSQTGAWRFIYLGNWETIGKSGWTLEREISKTMFTPEQWDAINSGMTDIRLKVIETSINNCINDCAHVGELTGRWEGASKEIITISPQTRNVNAIMEDTSGIWNNAASVLNSCSGKWDSIETLSSSAGVWNNLYEDIFATSGKWDSVYSTVYENSGGWISRINQVEENISTLSGDTSSLIASSTNWNEIFNEFTENEPKWDSVYSTVLANSGDVKNSIETIKSASGMWDSAVSSLSSTSADWNTTTTNVNTSASKWNDTFANVSSNLWKLNHVYSTVNDSSGDWEAAGSRIDAITGTVGTIYDIVSPASAKWNWAAWTIEQSGGWWNEAAALLKGTSGTWNAISNTVADENIYWSMCYNTVKDSSGAWETAGSGIDAISGAIYDIVLPSSASWNEAAAILKGTSSNWNATSEFVWDHANNWENAVDSMIKNIYLGSKDENNKLTRDDNGDITIRVGEYDGQYGIYSTAGRYNITDTPSGWGELKTILHGRLVVTPPTHPTIEDDKVVDRGQIGAIRPSYWPMATYINEEGKKRSHFNPELISHSSMTPLSTYVDNDAQMFALADYATAERNGVVRPLFDYDFDNVAISGWGIVYSVGGMMVAGAPCFKTPSGQENPVEYAGVVSPTDWLNKDPYTKEPIIPDGYTDVGSYIDNKAKMHGLIPYANKDTYGIVKMIEDDSTVTLTYKTIITD